jgi:hypothetical protein
MAHPSGARSVFQTQFLHPTVAHTRSSHSSVAHTGRSTHTMAHARRHGMTRHVSHAVSHTTRSRGLSTHIVSHAARIRVRIIQTGAWCKLLALIVKDVLNDTCVDDVTYCKGRAGLNSRIS